VSRREQCNTLAAFKASSRLLARKATCSHATVRRLPPKIPFIQKIPVPKSTELGSKPPELFGLTRVVTYEWGRNLKIPIFSLLYSGEFGSGDGSTAKFCPLSDNSEQRLVLARDSLSAFDPSATLAVGSKTV
jgi:hypothetical protein